MGVTQVLRQGSVEDAVDGVVPPVVAVPKRPEELAQVLAAATLDKQLTVLRGGASKLGWGRPPQRVDLVITTEKLNALIAHRHGDMTVTAQAGMPLTRLNALLAEHGQYLPVESAFANATVGGIVATNDAGPMRYRFGTPRDLLIGVTLAMTDGRLVNAGGTVVKNVAGYDLGKLVSGSHGTLAAIVDVTFKLLPVPHASKTLVATYADGKALAHDVAVLHGSQVEFTAFDISLSDQGRCLLLMRMVSSPAATDAQASQARRLVSSAPTMVSGEEERALWDEQIRAPWSEAGTVVRFSWLPSNLAAVFSLFDRVRANGCRVAMFTGRTSGAGFVRFEGEDSVVAGAIGVLRSSEHVGHVVVVRASRRLKEHVDVWGPATGASEVARLLKRKFDPAGILNAGRGPI